MDPRWPAPLNHTVPDDVIPAAPGDVGTLSQVIAGAFHDLAPSRWLIGDPGDRERIFPAYFAVVAGHAMTSGVVHTTPERAAVALWLPIGIRLPEPDPGYGTRLEAVTSPWAARFRLFDAALERRHPEGRPHHHLAILAVRPDRQRQGIGSALLGAHHAALDEAGMPSYLEASDVGARRFYLAHGYQDHGEPLILPGGGPAMFPMWREPAA